MPNVTDWMEELLRLEEECGCLAANPEYLTDEAKAALGFTEGGRQYASRLGADGREISSEGDEANDGDSHAGNHGDTTPN